MKKESVKPDITEYGFLRLYAAVMVAHNQNPIIKNHELEKELYKFCDNPEYKFLFGDIAIRADGLEQENSYVNLSTAFELAYALGLFVAIQDSGNLKSVISFSVDEAKKIISEFPIEQVNAVESLVDNVVELKNNINNIVLLKREKQKNLGDKS